MDNKKTPREEVDNLLIKYLTGSASPKEREEALAWINESQKNKVHFDRLKDYFHLTKVIQEPSVFDKEKGWERVRADYYKARFDQKEENIKGKRGKTFIRYASSIAASILLAFFAGLYINNLIEMNVPMPNLASYTIEAPFGSKSQVSLPDGSKVWLNSGSTLSYSGNFAKNNRRVHLQGEAFFDVAKSKKLPFIVETSNLNIKVYGTRFNVKSYPEEDKILTTLVEGSLAIETHEKKQDKKLVYLEPNQTATYYKRSSALNTSKNIDARDKGKQDNSQNKIKVIEKIDPLPVTSWKDNKWIFEGEELGQMAIKLERRYNVNIQFENESIKKYKFSGTLLEETFEQVLKVIQLSAPIDYTIEKNRVWLKEDKNYKMKYDKMITN